MNMAVLPHPRDVGYRDVSPIIVHIGILPIKGLSVRRMILAFLHKLLKIQFACDIYPIPRMRSPGGAIGVLHTDMTVTTSATLLK